MATHRPDVDEILYRALEIESPEERSSYLKEVCGQDVSLLERLESLVDMPDDISGFLETPVQDLAQLLVSAEPLEKVGATIDGYRLLEQIGEGGMGVVYMAEQTEPLQRKVALKIVKPGMDTRQVIARFEAERQALALMDHANIAKVYDAGATQSGRPYFVMELVRGTAITEFCDVNQLTTQRRLELFVTICRAVQHAHQKGVIHRDIKPSNVLVTLHDGQPVPKIIDFGVAKATHQKLTEKTLFTGFAQILGTPAYMSPEQAEWSGLDVDTRSDIYSLGVLLYELLTGTPPFDVKRFQQAAFDEVLRTIREDEPLTPSNRMSSLGDGLASVARDRGVEPGRLLKLVRGDLDWIVMKALEKERVRRYESAGDLASDVLRYLNNEPVEARRASRLYRFRKLVQRHRAASVGVCAVLVSLLFGLAGTTWQAHRAGVSEREAERRAESERLLRNEVALLQTIATAYRQAGAEGIILGCTEIPLAISADQLPLPTFDATEVLAQRAVDMAMSPR